MALALEDIGWGTADHWLRMQASYDLAQARRRSGRHPVREREERPGAALGRVAEAAGEYRAGREVSDP